MDRLFEMVLLLMERKKMTAQQIADYFEISQRTVLRDIDKLLVAGIPVETSQGYEGGISLEKGYQLSVDFINRQEKEALIAGLRAIDSVYQGTLATKLTQKMFQQDAQQHLLIDIDLSSWYGTSLLPKIDKIKTSLVEKKQLSFFYYANNTQSKKVVSPYQLVFRWGNWYLRGICEKNQAFRLYKLNRMDDLQQLNQPASLREYQSEASYFQQQNYFLIAHFNHEAKAQLIDAYGLDSFVETAQQLYFERWFVDKRYLISWLLSFGGNVEVLEPLEIRNEIAAIIDSMKLIYQYDS